MAPVPFKHPFRYSPLLLAATHLTSIVYFTYAVGDSLYTSYKSLGPLSNTRSRIAQRKRLLPVFFGLAVTSCLVATYCSLSSATLSYKTWAYEHGLDLTQRILGEPGKDSNYIPDTKNSSSQLYIGQWLSDTPIYHDALEIVAEKARRFWWGQQIDLGITAFSLMLATEGRRRNVPLLTAFLALAHLVNLSFAQNLFFLALLLTPSPLPKGDGDLRLPVVPIPTSTWTQYRDKLIPPKPNSWVPDARLFYAAIALNFASSFVLPYAAGTSSFSKVAFLVRASTFLPLLLPKIVPVKWGSIQKHPHSSYESTTKLFRLMSAAAFALHAKTTLVALMSNISSSHYHRHSALLPWDMEERSRWERSTTALGKVLGSTSDHPVVAAVGWDAILSALSLGIWAAVRALKAKDMIQSAVPSFSSLFNYFKHGASSERGDEPRSHFSGKIDEDEDEDKKEDEEEDEFTFSTQAVRRRARGGNSPSPPRRRNRTPRKNKYEEDEDDKAYVPTPAVARSALEGDELPARDLDWESAVLAWCMAAAGGLPFSLSAVLGGECIS